MAASGDGGPLKLDHQAGDRRPGHPRRQTRFRTARAVPSAGVVSARGRTCGRERGPRAPAPATLCGAGQPVVQAEPLRLKAEGFGLLPEWVPWNPNDVLAPGASEPL